MAEKSEDLRTQDDAITARARKAAEVAVSVVVRDGTRAARFAELYQTIRPLLLAREIHPVDLGEFGQALAAAAQLEYALRQQLENNIETRRLYDPEGRGGPDLDVSGEVVGQLIDAARTSQAAAAGRTADPEDLAWWYS